MKDKVTGLGLITFNWFKKCTKKSLFLKPISERQINLSLSKRIRWNGGYMMRDPVWLKTSKEQKQHSDLLTRHCENSDQIPKAEHPIDLKEENIKTCSQVEAKL